MKRMINASEIIMEDEQDLIFLPESMIEEIDNVIKHANYYPDGEEFVTAVIEKFIMSALKER
jgi:hypothetical protein